MPDATPDPKPRSAFLTVMLLVVCVGVVVGVVAFVPVGECEACLGVRSFTFKEWVEIHRTETGGCAFVGGGRVMCEWCGKAGKTTLWQKLMRAPPKNIDTWTPPLDFRIPPLDLRKILENRRSRRVKILIQPSCRASEALRGVPDTRCFPHVDQAHPLRRERGLAGAGEGRAPAAELLRGGGTGWSPFPAEKSEESRPPEGGFEFHLLAS